MELLKELLETYKELTQNDDLMEENFFSAGKETLNFTKGSVIEVSFRNLPLLLCVINEEKYNVKVALMSDFWELATNKDVFVRFSHPIRDTWIVETDIVKILPKNFLKRVKASFRGKINQSDLKQIENLLSGKKISSDSTGIGYNDEIHKEFKKIERKRFNKIFTQILNFKDEGKLLIFEPRQDIISAFLTKEPLVASSDSKSLETERFQAVAFPDKRILLLWKNNIYGKRGTIGFKFENTSFDIYEGTIKDLEFRNVDKSFLNLLKYLYIEAKNDQETS